MSVYCQFSEYKNCLRGGRGQKWQNSVQVVFESPLVAMIDLGYNFGEMPRNNIFKQCNYGQDLQIIIILSDLNYICSDLESKYALCIIFVQNLEILFIGNRMADTFQSSYFFHSRLQQQALNLNLPPDNWLRATQFENLDGFNSKGYTDSKFSSIGRAIKSSGLLDYSDKTLEWNC